MYTLNKESAAKGSKTGGEYITEAGIYVGTIRQLEIVKFDSGAEKVIINFRADSGQEARYLDLFTVKKDGEQSFGYNVLMSIMWLCQVKTLTPVQTKDHKGNAITTAKEIEGKKIALAIQMEEYLDKEGVLKTKPAIYCAFSATDKKSASEQQEGKPAEKINLTASYLAANGLRKYKPKRGAPKPKRESSDDVLDGLPQSFDTQFDDDIPF